MTEDLINRAIHVGRIIRGRRTGSPTAPSDYNRTFSFAVRKGDVGLVEKLNQGMRINKANGQYDRIYEKWLSAEGSPAKWEEYFWPALVVLALLAVFAVAWRLPREAARWDQLLARALTPQRHWSVPAVWRYALAIAAVAAATALRGALTPWLKDSIPFSLHLVATLSVTVLLGLRPGLACMLLSVVAVETLVLGTPLSMWNREVILRTSVTMAIGAFVVSLLHAARVAAARAYQSESRLRMQRKRMPIGCIVYDEQNRFSEINPAAERIFGHTEADLKGRHATAVVPEAVRPHVDGILRRLAEGDMTAHSENENLTQDGRTIICQWTR